MQDAVDETVTVTNDDAPTVTLALAGASIREADDPGTPDEDHRTTVTATYSAGWEFQLRCLARDRRQGAQCHDGP